MRTIEYGTTTTHVPAFLTKLWKLVTDVDCDDLISWSLGGTSFIIYDEIRFSKELLPMYFKHNNMASFVRQLNMYGFRKLSCIDQGGMHCYKNEIEFYHQYFLKGQESLLELIKRKIPNSKSEDPKVKQEYIDELLSNLQALKGKQDTAEHNMQILARENKMLWRHVTTLADQYTQQQSVIQQLVPFFVNMCRHGPTRHDMSLKRKPSLMIGEGETHNKVARLSPEYFVVEDQDSNQGTPVSPGNVSNRGPVIHDVTEMENNKMYPGTILCPSNSTTTKECEAIVNSPLSNSLESSEQTIDSQFTEAASMERINILNQNFERRARSNSYSPPMEMNRSPPSTSNSSMRRRSPPSSYSSTTTSSSSLSPTIIIDEATSDVPISDNIMRNPFAPKIEEICSESNGLYNMNPMMSEKVPAIINEETISLLSESTAPHMNGGPVMTNGNKYTPSPSFAPHLQNIKSDVSEINWMMNQPAPTYVEHNSIENWLGQFIKQDPSSPCSMPQPQANAVGNVGYV